MTQSSPPQASGLRAQGEPLPCGAVPGVDRLVGDSRVGDKRGVLAWAYPWGRANPRGRGAPSGRARTERHNEIYAVGTLEDHIVPWRPAATLVSRQGTAGVSSNPGGTLGHEMVSSLRGRQRAACLAHGVSPDILRLLRKSERLELPRRRIPTPVLPSGGGQEEGSHLWG